METVQFLHDTSVCQVRRSDHCMHSTNSREHTWALDCIDCQSHLLHYHLRSLQATIYILGTSPAVCTTT